MAEDYPTLDPTTYDLIISGTGLPSSLIAAASAAAGKSVLHLDPNPFYGSHFASLPPSSLSHHLELLELTGSVPEPSRSFSLDLAGPRLLYCADLMVDLLLRSGASHHVEFKSVDGSLIYSEGAFCSVPDSRQAIFRDRSLVLGEKREMMRFLKLVQGHIGNEDGVRVSDEELEMPFVEFLKRQKLPPKIRS